MASDRLVAQLLDLLHLVRTLSHPVRRGEITPEQYWLLRRLRKAGELSVGELAEQLGISQSSATIACQRLERQGLLTRRRSGDDERVVLVALTDHGVERLEAWAARRREALSQVVAHLEPDEQADLERLLTRLLAHAEEQSGR